jgi:hypothetical protein
MRARPRSSNNLARLPEQGISGFLCLSRTNTAVISIVLLLVQN